MSRPAVPGGARIGPNAVLQMVPVLDTVLGIPARAALLREAGLNGLPASEGLMAEAPAARLHQALRATHPLQAAEIAAAAGARTGDYILANRIPRVARAILMALPPALGGPLLSRAIARHAWTFAGSGRFRVVAPWPAVFEIADNPVVRGERAAAPLCAWHAAVFERLFARLVDGHARCREVACCAAGAPACRFEVRTGA